ncbi:hypothetical protein Henu3_gp61 [Mycobacterium phage Henu3 PeY-2017]|nr:hypothetical protein Henu3_gp61 [Mycobacterium phage Henu3 PeY-2017]
MISFDIQHVPLSGISRHDSRRHRDARPRTGHLHVTVVESFRTDEGARRAGRPDAALHVGACRHGDFNLVAGVGARGARRPRRLLPRISTTRGFIRPCGASSSGMHTDPVTETGDSVRRRLVSCIGNAHDCFLSSYAGLSGTAMAAHVPDELVAVNVVAVVASLMVRMGNRPEPENRFVPPEGVNVRFPMLANETTTRPPSPGADADRLAEPLFP